MSTKPVSEPVGSPTPRALLFPPWLLILIDVISVQIGASLAKSLFDTIGFPGVVFLRTFIGGLVFLLFMRPRLRGHSRRVYLISLLYGATIAGNMLAFYSAIERIPLGITVAIAFAGPLIVSVLGSRRAVDFLWIGLAAVGILLLSPFSDATLDPVGLLLAGVCACAWGIYIIVAKRASGLLPGNTVLALAMCAAALVSAPFGAVRATTVLTSPALLGITLVVALLSTIIPFWLEFAAIKHLEPRVFGLLLSLEPAVAALIGLVILHENLSLETAVGIGLVTIAAAATTRTAKPDDAAKTYEAGIAALPLE